MTKDNINKHEILQKITPVIEKAAQDKGLLVVETDFVKEAGNWTVRVFLYDPQKPVTLEDCENATRTIDPYLEEIIDIPYRLEVSSPGTERKLKSDREYTIFKGERVKIKLKKTAERETKTFLAKIRDYTEGEGLTLERPDQEDEIKIKKEEISSVKLEPEYEFNKKKK